MPIGGTLTADKASGEQKHQLNLEQVRFAFFSGGPFTFRVEIVERASVQKELGLPFKWTGDWKLTRIILPAAAMDAFQSARRVTPPQYTVVVAAVPLDFGTTINPEDVIEIPWTSKMPEGAFATRDELFKDGGRVALARLQRNELILKKKITEPGWAPSNNR